MPIGCTVEFEGISLNLVSHQDLEIPQTLNLISISLDIYEVAISTIISAP